MASIDSDGAPQADAGSQLSASSSRDSDMARKLQNAKCLTIQLLQEITDDFSEERKIGQGAYGKVYVAKLENGNDIAVKLLYNNMPGIDDVQFQREFENLMRLEHHNIVRLVGYCYETQHQPMQYMGRTIFAERTYRALCFEYMQNGSLQKHLSEECNGLDWHTRYKIIKGTCEGLKHLHQGFAEPIYHLDLKPDNILLDSNMVPKLADFGLSKLFGDQQTMITQSPIGTIGYLPMEFLQGNIVSSKFDIFSLGVVMIRIIGGPEAYSRSFEMCHEEFIDLVHANWRNRMQKTCHAYRPLEAYCEQVNTCTKIALTCMDIDRHKRPNIADIIHQMNDTETVIDKALRESASLSQMNGHLVKLRAFTGNEGVLDVETRSDFPVLVQVIAPPWGRMEEMQRAGVDIVVVFDLKSSNDLDQEGMGIVINRLSSNDRLSLVMTGTHPQRLMELTFMTDKGQAEANGNLFSRTKDDPNSTSIAAGLREATEILRGREAEESDSRVGCVVLLSDSGTAMIRAEEISPEFPVHTVGLYDDHDPEPMKYIADNTFGTYSFCSSIQDLKVALELFMAGIVKVAATSITITLRAHDGIAISSIESGSYRNNVSSDNLSGEIDIHDIYAGEQKNFIAYLTLPEGKQKLLTISGRYRSLNATTRKQLPDTHVFVLRPRSGCSPGKLAMRDNVASELARIWYLKRLLEVTRGGRLSQAHFNIYKLCFITSELVRGTGYSLPEETISRLGNYMAEISATTSDYYSSDFNPYRVPYLMSWLSCHEWQRATAKGQRYESGAFTLVKPGDADGEDDD